MNILKRLVRLYPAAWRTRYEEEFLAVLEQRPASLGVVLNILFGIADAHLHYDMASGNLSVMERMKYMLERLKKTYTRGLIAFLVFLIPCVLLNAMIDDSPLMYEMNNISSLGVVYIVHSVSLLLAGLAVLTGGLAILYGVFKWARAEKRKDVLLLLFVPAAVFVIFTAVFFLLNLGLLKTADSWMRGSVNQCLGILFLAIFGVCICSVLRKAETGEKTVRMFGKAVDVNRIAVRAALTAASGMAAATVSAVVWDLMAGTYAPFISNSSLGIFKSNTVFMLIFTGVIMLVSAAASGIIAVRGAKLLNIKHTAGN